MPRQEFHIIVEVLNCKERETAIATAASYLAYTDQTDTIGHAPAYTNVSVRSNDAGPLTVGLTVEVQISNDKHLKRFMDEITQLSRVLSVERGEA